MKHIEIAAVTAQATFGRDSAMFEGLLGFVAQLSVVLWGLVVLTVVFRFVGIRIYRRAARKALAVAAAVAAPSAAVAAAAPITTGVVDLVQPAGGQLTDAGPVRRGLSASTAAKEDAVLVPAERVDGELVDVLTNDAVRNATFDEGTQPAEAPAAATASAKVPRHATRNWRAEPRSAAQVHALTANSFAANSTEA